MNEILLRICDGPRYHLICFVHWAHVSPYCDLIS